MLHIYCVTFLEKMDKEWKMFGIKGKLVLSKQKVFRLISGSGCVCAQFDQDPKPRTFNLQVYISTNQRVHEIETEKAKIVLLSRHERWKAGGPL